MPENIPNYVRLPLQSAFNVRDLGGYPVPSGVTRFRAFLRGGRLHNMTEKDTALLLDYGLGTVVDLRAEYEMAERPNAFADHPKVDYLPLPLAVEDVTEMERGDADAGQFLTDYCVVLLRHGSENIRQIFEAFAGAKPGMVLFHCSAGKDRTGLIAALLLGLCGAEEVDILSNYQVSGTYNSANLEMAAAGYPKEMYLSLPEYLEPALSYIRERGGARQYLLDIGVSSESLAKIFSRLVESV